MAQGSALGRASLDVALCCGRLHSGRGWRRGPWLPAGLTWKRKVVLLSIEMPILMPVLSRSPEQQSPDKSSPTKECPLRMHLLLSEAQKSREPLATNPSRGFEATVTTTADQNFEHRQMLRPVYFSCMQAQGERAGSRVKARASTPPLFLLRQGKKKTLASVPRATSRRAGPELQGSALMGTCKEAE